MKIKLVMLFAVTIIAIVFSSCKKDKVVSKTISGIVVNVATKQPVTNMKVVFSAVNDTRHGFYYVGDLWGSYKEEHQATTTDEYGKFQFENIKTPVIIIKFTLQVTAVCIMVTQSIVMMKHIFYLIILVKLRSC